MPALAVSATILLLLIAPAWPQSPRLELRKELRKLQPDIDQAIDDGVQWLLERQLPDGSWGYLADQYPNGQTALSVYTLLKSGLPSRHAAVQRGLTFLKSHEPTRTYSLSLQMMAFEATHDPAYKPLIKKLLSKLISWQVGAGTFGYPGFPGGRGGGGAPRAGSWTDLSNTQFAALGLRAAMLAGLRIPRKVLQRLLAETLLHQESQQQVKLPPDAVKPEKDGYARTPKPTGYSAGFLYRKSRRARRSGSAATGSMTTAGMGVLLIVRDCYGKGIPQRINRKIRRHVEVGLNWLRMNWSVESNPGKADGRAGPGAGGGWRYYYLYGLERVGSLLMEEIIAGHAWYLEGARVLVRDQNRNGAWGGRRGSPPSACFALLFLRRATWIGGTTGESTTVKDTFETTAGDVLLKGHGSSQLVMWMNGFSESIRDCWKIGMKRTDMRVLRVEYLIDDVRVAAVEGNPSRTWKGETFAARHTFERPGTYVLSVRVHLLPPGVKRHAADTRIVVLASESQEITVERVVAPAPSKPGR